MCCRSRPPTWASRCPRCFWPSGPSRGRSPEATFPRDWQDFVAAPVLVTSALALIVFYAILALHVVAAGGLERRLAQEELEVVHAAALPLAQTGLATFLVWCGL